MSIRRLMAVLRAPSMLLSTAAAAAVWLLSLSGALDRYSGWLYDALQAGGWEDAQGRAKVLLIEYDPDSLPAPEQLEQLYGKLSALGPAQLLFDLPGPPSPALAERARQEGRSVFALRLAAPGDAVEELRLQPWPAGLERGLVTGVAGGGVTGLQARQGGDGIYRRMAPQLHIGDRVYPGVEAVAASQRLGKAYTPPPRPFLINFTAGPGAIPRASLQRALAGGLISELVQGRSVLIGPAAGPAQLRQTPLAPPGGMMSLSELRARALDTLLRDRVIRLLSPAAQLGLLWLLAFASAIVYGLLPARLGLALTLGLLAGYAALSWLALHVLALWPPLGELVLMQCGVAALTYRYLGQRRDEILHRLMVESNSRLQRELPVASFLSSQDPWPAMIDVVKQLLDLTRMIFLGRVEGDHRLIELASYRCELGDIEERRRDYERQPYSDAIAEKGPIEPFRPYFKDAHPEAETVFLVPLEAHGTILGFWALGVRQDRLASSPAFRSIVRELAVRIAALLDQRQRYQQLLHEHEGLLGRALKIDFSDRAMLALQRGLGLLARQHDMLLGVAEGMGTAIAVYDTFGHLLRVNAAMDAYVRARGLAIYKLNALDFAVTLTGLPPEQARATLLRVVTDQEPAALLIRSQASEVAGLLHVRPMGGQSLGEGVLQAAGGEPGVQLTGYLFELADVSTMQRFVASRETLMRHLGRRLQEDMEGLQRVLRESGTAPQAIEAGIAGSLALVRSMQGYLQADPAAATPTAELPTDLVAALNAALAALAPEMRGRGLRAELGLPPVAVVMAGDEALQRALEQLLRILIETAARDSVISLKMSALSEPYRAQLRLSNSGYALSDERLQAQLQGRERDATGPFAELAQLHTQFELWGGELRGHGEIASGIEFDLRLRPFADAPPAPRT